jgi:chromosome segregation ATPase
MIFPYHATNVKHHTLIHLPPQYLIVLNFNACLLFLQSVIACGNKTLRNALDEIWGGNIGTLNLDNLPSHNEGFAVGSSVEVAARLGPGFNKRGGAATVTDKRTDVDGVMTYTVAYTVEGDSEKDLPASLLSARTDVRECRLSSLSSSSAASVSSDERHVLAQIQQLRNTVGELQQRICVKQWQASCDRQQAAALREKLKGLSRDLKKAATLMRIATEQLDQLKIQRQADVESMNATVQEIVVSAAEAAAKAAAVEAEGSFATKIKALSCRLRAVERARKDVEGAAEQARNAAAAESACLLANVQSLLDDTKHAAEEKHKRTLQEILLVGGLI